MSEQPRRREPRPEGDATGGLIPYKNSSALLAYYFGIFSLIPCIGIVLGIAAVILGIKGLRYRTEHPEAKGSVHAWIGIILGGLMAFIYTAIVIVNIVIVIMAETR